MKQRFLNRRKSAQYVRAFGFPCSEKQLEKLASVGGGPKFIKHGRRVFHEVQWLDEWIEEKLSAEGIAPENWRFQKFLNRRQAAEHLTEQGLSSSPSMLANLAWSKAGPDSVKFGGQVFYTVEMLDNWIEHLAAAPRANTIGA